ncbi:MAG: hypothetical protein HY897_07420 [Deltaproteobacteria bacterium]|nr:hypothetical protein [Deltaproteobacteria bacterium]
MRVRRTDPAITLHHYPAGCGVNDTGDARMLDDGTLALTYSIGELVDEDTCAAPGCGGCAYDFTFVVHGEVPVGSMLKIDIVRTVCWDTETTPVALAIRSQAEGMLCKYAPWARKGWEGDKLHQACRFDVDEHGTPVGEKYCLDGMVCKNPTGQRSNDFDICLAPCQTDAECPYPDLLSCQDGLCVLKEQW